MAETKCGIYSIRCSLNGKMYIGSSYSIHQRWSRHRSELRKCKSNCIILQHAWTFYGEKTFVFAVLEECSREDLEAREQLHIDQHKPALNSITDISRRRGVEQNAKIVASIRARAALRTHCPHGHEYTPENVYMGKKPGDKRCRACCRDRLAASYAAETTEHAKERLRKGMERYYANYAEKRAKGNEYAAKNREAKRLYDIAYRPIKNARRRIKSTETLN